LTQGSCEGVSPSTVAAWGQHLEHLNTGTARTIAELGAGTLVRSAQRSAEEGPHRPALLFPAESDRWISHGELAERSSRISGWLAENGLRPGARALLCGDNTTSLVLAYLALLRCGATVVLANPGYTAAELAHLVADSGAEWAIATAPAAERISGVRVLSLDEPLPESIPSTVDSLSAQDRALLAYTSGTTGEPKGVPLTHGNLLSSIRAAMVSWRWSSEDVLVHCLPLSHQHGLGGVHATLIAGSSAVILPRFDPTELSEAVVSHAPSVLFAVPALYKRLVDEADHVLAAGSLRLAVSGSAPLDPDLAQRIGNIMGTPPLERYGSTESGLNVSHPIDGPRLPGTVGLPLPGVELRIADASGEQVRDGTDGEILLRGPQVFSGYWNHPAATQEALRPDGWFRTGDLGRIDKHTGYLSITGRKKELIITGGMNVYPREVELALEQHPAVAEAAVAGLASQRWGEEVAAWVVANSDVDTDDIIRHAATVLAKYKCPKRVFVVDSLPRNSMGKLRRSVLAPPLDTTGLDRAVATLWKASLS
jgi:malonyl-CoA/methylmalonyl-CoA synthetase